MLPFHNACGDYDIEGKTAFGQRFVDQMSQLRRLGIQSVRQIGSPQFAL
jgi:hypothetical protein